MRHGGQPELGQGAQPRVGTGADDPVLRRIQAAGVLLLGRIAVGMRVRPRRARSARLTEGIDDCSADSVQIHAFKLEAP